jgi:hypothetical protein
MSEFAIIPEYHGITSTHRSVPDLVGYMSRSADLPLPLDDPAEVATRGHTTFESGRTLHGKTTLRGSRETADPFVPYRNPCRL